MAYLNILTRERADLLDSPDKYKKQVEIADAWLQRRGYQEDRLPAPPAKPGGIPRKTRPRTVSCYPVRNPRPTVIALAYDLEISAQVKPTPTLKASCWYQTGCNRDP